jgi:sugar transferase (PEP-CTERM/EpsH1 system associated)
MIRHLSQKHSVIVATLAESEQELREGADLKEYCEDVIVELVPKAVRWIQAFRSLFSRAPSSVAYFSSATLLRRIKKALRNEKFDVIWVHCAFVARYVADVDVGFKILDYGDLDSAKWFEYARWRSFPLSLAYGLEARKLRKYERDVGKHFHGCTVTTRGELEEFEKLKLDAPCTLIPNGVDSTYFAPLPRSDRSARVIFVGRMDYFPNVDGAVYFARAIFPILRRNVPTAEFWIVGSNPGSEVQSLGTVPGITITGHVKDVRPYLAGSAVAVAPLRIARGTQNKILEAMAMGIPVVATSQASKGIDAAAGHDLLVADQPEAFAREVTRLLENAHLRNDLSLAGRQRVLDKHAWPNSMRILDRILAETPVALSDKVELTMAGCAGQ